MMPVARWMPDTRAASFQADRDGTAAQRDPSTLHLAIDQPSRQEAEIWTGLPPESSERASDVKRLAVADSRTSVHESA